MARNGNDKRVRSGGEDEPVITLDPARSRGDSLNLPVNRHHLIARHQSDVVIIIPGLIVDHDIVKTLLPREQRREHDPVIIDARFRPENRDAVFGRITR